MTHIPETTILVFSHCIFRADSTYRICAYRKILFNLLFSNDASRKYDGFPNNCDPNTGWFFVFVRGQSNTATLSIRCSLCNYSLHFSRSPCILSVANFIFCYVWVPFQVICSFVLIFSSGCTSHFVPDVNAFSYFPTGSALLVFHRVLIKVVALFPVFRRYVCRSSLLSWWRRYTVGIPTRLGERLWNIGVLLLFPGGAT